MKPCGNFVFYPFDAGRLFCWSLLVLGRYLAVIVDLLSSLSCNYLFLWIIVLFFLSFIIILSFVVAYAIPILISLILLLYLIELSYISFEVIYKWFFYTKGWTNALSICNAISFLIFFSMSPFRCVNLTFIQ